MWTEKILKTEVFENDDVLMIAHSSHFAAGNRCVSKFLRRGVDGTFITLRHDHVEIRAGRVVYRSPAKTNPAAQRLEVREE